MRISYLPFYFLLFSCIKNKEEKNAIINSDKAVTLPVDTVFQGCCGFTVFGRISENLILIFRKNDSAIQKGVLHKMDPAGNLTELFIEKREKGEIYNDPCSDIIIVNAKNPDKYPVIHVAGTFMLIEDKEKGTLFTGKIDSGVFVIENDTIKISNINIDFVPVSNCPG